mmetsp:Transcript_43021/g.31000  ORF Transcript_43021/g.31000 Transcript_43021/m.31000 type:complete len:124 (+) Transcript_43021:105-476(+)|eukprot:CAMPEP_0116874126 /NCGR_PEP_ID=MMETSP0463-20121206/5553_1 /TAXON_ID=181622 /ORGANISM="Strombidinopsis sp, Strain SopsisLIS2011" /LENGTH=123 /DNA_ID=CAMNT_0004517389 /DNA_START=47 /DNA_END=418 /DNA_ORIENTATION=+
MKLTKDVIKAQKSKKEIVAVVLVVNSPGGSPVYSSLMANKLVDLSITKKAPYFTFAEDVAASGGYWLLASGDSAFASKYSLVGSVGVITGAVAFKRAWDHLEIKSTEITTSENLMAYKSDPLR